MPREPVLVDDGGSIRIRNFNGNGHMDELLDVGPLPKPKYAIGSTVTIDGDFNEVKVVYQDKFGNPGKVKKQKFETILITCGANRYVLVERGIHKLNITICGIRIKPIVEARPSGGRRGYFVVDFGPIEKVNNNSKPIYVIRKGINKPIPDHIKMPVLWTSVVIT